MTASQYLLVMVQDVFILGPEPSIFNIVGIGVGRNNDGSGCCPDADAVLAIVTVVRTGGGLNGHH